MKDAALMTDEQLAAAVDEMFNSPDFDRIKFEAARRLREYAAKLAEVERERDAAQVDGAKVDLLGVASEAWSFDVSGAVIDAMEAHGVIFTQHPSEAWHGVVAGIIESSVMKLRARAALAPQPAEKEESR